MTWAVVGSSSHTSAPGRAERIDLSSPRISTGAAVQRKPGRSPWRRPLKNPFENGDDGGRERRREPLGVVRCPNRMLERRKESLNASLGRRRVAPYSAGGRGNRHAKPHYRIRG